MNRHRKGNGYMTLAELRDDPNTPFVHHLYAWINQGQPKYMALLKDKADRFDKLMSAANV